MCVYDATAKRRSEALIVKYDMLLDEYTELLTAMKLRDGRLDPVWMEQYATEKLAKLGKET